MNYHYEHYHSEQYLLSSFSIWKHLNIPIFLLIQLRKLNWSELVIHHVESMFTYHENTYFYIF